MLVVGLYFDGLCFKTKKINKICIDAEFLHQILTEISPVKKRHMKSTTTVVHAVVSCTLVSSFFHFNQTVQTPITN